MEAKTLLSWPDIGVLPKMSTKKKMSERDVKIHPFQSLQNEFDAKQMCKYKCKNTEKTLD